MSDESETDQIQKTIHISELKSVIWAGPSDDFLPGFNFYLELSSKLILLSTKTAVEALRIVQTLRICKHYYQKLVSYNLLFDFPNALSLFNQLINFKAVSFFGAVQSELDFFSEDFQLNRLHESFNSLKKYLNLFSKNNIKIGSVAEFIALYHVLISKYVEKTTKKLSADDTVHLLGHLSKYHKLITQYGLNDSSLREFLCQLQTNLNARILESANEKISAKVSVYFEKSNRQNNYHQNFYSFVFQVLLEETLTFSMLGKINLDLIEQCIEHCSRLLHRIILTKKDVSLIQLIHLLNSTCKFNREFFDFLEKNSQAKIDLISLENLPKSKLGSMINVQLKLFYKEIHNCLENKVIRFFSEQTSFELLDPVHLFSKQLFEFILKIRKNLLSNLSEQIINNTLNVFLRLYFLSLMSSFYMSANELHYEKKLERDKTAVFKFFQSFLEPENLNAQIDTFNQFYTLLTETNIDKLMQAIIKFDLFFNNKLQAETVSTIFEKNIYVSFETENEILSCFSEKIQIKEKSFRLNKSSLNNSNNSSKTPQVTKTVCNYLSYISLEILLKIKIRAFKAKSRVFLTGLQDNLDLSQDSDLSFQETGESRLENFIKIVVLDGISFDVHKFQQKLKVV